MQKNHCDMCHKEIVIHPKVEKIFEEKEVEIPYDPKDPTKTMKVMQKVPVLVTMLRQNHRDGKMEEIKVQKVKDLEERAYFLRLTVGDEHQVRELCGACVEIVRPLFKPLWDKMSAMKSKA